MALFKTYINNLWCNAISIFSYISGNKLYMRESYYRFMYKRHLVG